MRKALFVLFTVSLAFVLACNSQPSSNGNAGGNISGNANLKADAPPGPLDVFININYSSGSPFQLLIDGPNASGARFKGDHIHVSLAKYNSINWRVNYVASGSAPNIKVGIDDFKDEQAKPIIVFGTKDEHNKFDLGVLSTSGPTAQMASQPLATTGTFKYRITIEVSATIKLVLDPIIIITTFN
jgi:hypothetical protein